MNTKRAGLLGAFVALFFAALAFPAAALQLHGISIFKGCNDTKVGDPSVCTIRFANADDFGDTINLTEVYDIVKAAGGDVRVPAAGNLPIVFVDPGVNCAAGAGPIGLVFPCELPGALNGSDLGVTVIAEYTPTAEDPNPLPDQAQYTFFDLCDAPGTSGCNPGQANATFNAQTDFFAPAIEVTKTGPEIAKAGDSVTYSVSFANNSSPDTPDLTCQGSDALKDGGAPFPITPGQEITYDHTIPVDASGSVINTVTVTCDIDGFENQVFDSDSHEVLVFTPAISVDKSGPELAKAGDTITYTVLLDNDSSANTPALTCTATDALKSGGAPFAIVPGQSVNYDYAIPADATGSIDNTVSVTCSIAGFQNTVSAEDSHSVLVFTPAISVSKSGPTIAKAGDTISYTVLLSDDSSANTPALTCSADDSLVGPLGAIVPGQAIHYDYAIPADAAGSIDNTVSVNCSIAGFQNTVEASDDHSVLVFTPAISVDKSGPDVAKAGDTITYTVLLTDNSSANTPALTCTATDALTNGGAPFPIVPGQAVNYDYAVPADASGAIDNTVSVSCSIAGFQNTVEASDGHSVLVFTPAISVDKSGPQIAKTGDTITYTVLLSNDSSANTPDLSCTASDALNNGGAAFPIVPGQAVNYDYAIPADASGSIQNTVEVTCDIAGFQNQVFASDGHSVDVFTPAISVDKSGPANSKAGDSVTYTVLLSNDSSPGTPALTCTATDALTNGGAPFPIVPGQAVNYDYVIPVDAPGTVNNTVSVTCAIAGFQNTVVAEDGHSIEVFTPAIDVDKSGPAIAKAGDTVTYTVLLSNNSPAETPELSCTASDALKDGGAPFPIVPGQAVNYDAVIPADAAGSFDNTVTVTCDIAGFENQVFDSDTHTIEVFTPAISVDKSGPDSSKAGDTVTYTVLLSNDSTAGTPALTCTASDALKDGGAPFPIVPGEAITYDYAIPSDAEGAIDNTVAVTCSIEGFQNIVEASDDHSLLVFTPAISVDKTGPDIAKAGDTVTYTVLLSDDSSDNTPALTCTATDALTNGGAPFPIVPGQALSYDYAIPADAAGAVENTVSVSCSIEGFENTVEASDGHSVAVFTPSITVEKTGPASSKAGDTVTYSVTVDNTSSPGTPALSCTAEDSLAGSLGAIAADGVPVTYDLVIPADASGPVVNTVTVTCDVAGFQNQVFDSDSHTVEVFTPAIAVDKSGPEISKAGDTVTYTVLLSDLSSPGSPALSCTASDALVNGGAPFPIVPGQAITYDYAIPADASGSIDNTVVVTCTVAGFANTVSASDGHSLVVFTPAISVDKSGPEISKTGDTVTYTVLLSDDSSAGTPALSCTASDALKDGGAPFPIVPGQAVNYDYLIPADASGTVDNTVTVTCDIAGFQNQVFASDSHSVTVFTPAISVDKSGPTIVKAGDTATYTVLLSNDSSANTPALSCTATDALANGGAPFPIVPGQAVNYDYAIPAGSSGAVDNTVTVTCSIAGFQNTVSASDGHQVLVFTPGISVDKSGPAASKAGDTVTYTVLLSNNSSANTPALSCTASDALKDGGAAFPIVPGQPVSYDHAIPADATGTVENTVSVTCSIAGFPNQVSASDGHSIQLLAPAVNLAKVCRPDPVHVGETLTWEITVENTGDAALDCLVNDPTAGIVDAPFNLAPGASDFVTADREMLPEDEGVISNTASVSCTLTGGVLPNVLTGEATADCEVLPDEEFPGDVVCRTPGFWGTHAGTEKSRSTNITQAVIDAAGGSLMICGKTIDNTNVGNTMSAVEAICVSPQGTQQLQLARQLTAMALNCVVSGVDATCGGTFLEPLFAEANAACASGSGNVSGYIAQIDCFNNGGHWENGICTFDEDDCHERELDESFLFEGQTGLPGPAGSSKACNAANKNNVFILP